MPNAEKLAVLGGELYAFGEGADEADRLGGLVEGLVAGDAELALEMEVGGGEDDVDPVGGGGLDGAGGGLDVFAFTAGERGDAGPADLAGNCSDGREVQWHTLSRWFANVEIYICLFVAFGVLLSPQNQQKRRKFRKHPLRPVDLRMTSRTESDHQMQQRLAQFPMMDFGIGITANPTKPIHRALRPARAGRRNIRHPAVSACSRSRRGPGRGSSHSRRDSKLRSGSPSSKPYSFVFSLESFSRMNASISAALARMRMYLTKKATLTNKFLSARRRQIR